MANKINTRIQLKHDIEANWLQATGFTPLDGELIIYDKDDNYSYERVKMGDGVTNVNALPFTKEGIINITSLSDIKRVGLYNLNNEALYQATYIYTQNWTAPEVGMMTKKGFKAIDATATAVIIYTDSTGGTGRLEVSNNILTINGTSHKNGTQTTYTGSAEGELTFDTIINEQGQTLRKLGIIFVEVNETTSNNVQMYANILSDELTITEITNKGVGITGEIETGEVFNDYKENAALGGFAHAEGRTTTAGSRAFTIIDFNVANKTFTLDDVTGLSTGDKYSVQVYYNNSANNTYAEALDIGTIVSISGKVVKVSDMPSFLTTNCTKAKYTVNYVDDDFDNEMDTFRIISKPNLGSRNIGYATHVEGRSTQAFSKNAHAEGNKTKAIAAASHAEGKNTKTYGVNSHAEGEETTAKGTASHTEGRYTTSSGNYAHAEGSGTSAQGQAAHAEGENCEARGDRSHAEGYATVAFKVGAHTEGTATRAREENSHAEGYASEGIGSNSHAEGNNTYAIGSNSHSQGASTASVGANSHTGGKSSVKPDKTIIGDKDAALTAWDTARAQGLNKAFSAAAGNESFAHGIDNFVYGQASAALGYTNRVKGAQSAAIGHTNIVNQNKSVALGLGNTINATNGEGRIAVGKYNQDTGALFMVGNGTASSPSNALEVSTLGEVKAQGDIYSNNIKVLVEGNVDWNNDVTNKPGISAGTGVNSIKVDDNNADYSTDATQKCAVAIGKAKSTGEYAFSIGDQVEAKGKNAIAAGLQNTASGVRSIALGQGSQATHTGAVVSGVGLRSTQNHQLIVGQWNDKNRSGVFAVGAGTADDKRKNTFEVGSTEVSFDNLSALNEDIITVYSQMNFNNLVHFDSSGFKVTGGAEINANDAGMSIGEALIVGSHDRKDFIDAGLGYIGATNLIHSNGNISADGDIYAGGKKVLVEGEINIPDQKPCDWSEITNKPTNLLTTNSSISWYKIDSDKPYIEQGPNNSTTIGHSNTANGYESILLGYNNHSLGSTSYNGAFGRNNTLGDIEDLFLPAADSFAIGNNNTITGSQSFAAGMNNIIRDHKSIALGWDNVIEDPSEQYDGRVVVGRFNAPTGAIFSVGIGSEGNRTNGFEVYKNGTSWFHGNVTIGEDKKKVATEDYVSQAIANVHIPTIDEIISSLPVYQGEVEEV